MFGDIVDFSELREAIAGRRAEAAQIIRLAEEAERAEKAKIAEAAELAANAEAQVKAARAEADRRRELHSYIRGRGVTGLGHFTRLRNLENILRHGLLPRGTLERMGAEYVANDELRLDHLDGVCLSLSFPNYKLFYRYRKKFPGEDWVVIDISTEVIERKACIFNPCNAASGAMTRIEKERRMQRDALQDMFYDRDVDHGDTSKTGATKLRELLGLPDEFTTDPQAEVVVTESIEPELFDGVIFDGDDTPRNRQILDDFSRKFGPRWRGRFLPGRAAFTYRHDYTYWQADNG